MKDPNQEALRWFIQSEDDLEFVRWLSGEKKFLDKGCFVAQQRGKEIFR